MHWFASLSLVINLLDSAIQCLNYQGLVVELLKCCTVLSNRFPTSRGLTRRDKNNRKQKDLFQPQISFLSCMDCHFLNNQ